jgi:carbon storage regulator
MSGLALSRRPGQSIVIETPRGEYIEITLTGIHNNSARMSIDAPRDVTIDRKEIYKQKYGAQSGA